MYRATMNGTIPVAVKEPIDRYSSSSESDLQREYDLMVQCRHENVEEAKAIILTSKPIMLVMDLAVTCLDDYVHDRDRIISIEQMLKYAGQMARALGYAHAQDVFVLFIMHTYRLS